MQRRLTLDGWSVSGIGLALLPMPPFAVPLVRGMFVFLPVNPEVRDVHT